MITWALKMSMWVPTMNVLRFTAVVLINVDITSGLKSEDTCGHDAGSIQVLNVRWLGTNFTSPSILIMTIVGM